MGDRSRTLRSSVAGYALLFAIAAAILVTTHASLLDLPYFWDEMGQFVPAALDIYEHGWWISRSTLPNAHPPGVPAYLAAIWSVTGYSLVVTRLAMLALAAAGVVAVFALAVRLCRNAPGTPAFTGVLLLLCSPLFFTQSMMAQLDMPPFLFTAAALLLFLDERYRSSALVSVPLVLAKETSIMTPAVLALWLLAERRIRPALYYLLPAAALALWLVYLRLGTGHLFGNQEFTHYNLAFPLHPVRLSLTVVRRFFYIFVDNFHWIGTVILVVAWRRTRLFRDRDWSVTACVAAAQVMLVSVLGGAALERYLMPVLPLFYIAVAAAATALTAIRRRIAIGGMAAGLAASLFISSPFPFPYENNFAVVDFVTLQKTAAEYVEANFADREIVSAWPFSDALRRAEFGYVTKPVKARGIENFNRQTVIAAKPEVLVIYSRTWEPRWGVLQSDQVRRFLTSYYFYEPQIAPEDIEREIGLLPVARWERRGQWIEIYAKLAAPSLIL